MGSITIKQAKLIQGLAEGKTKRQAGIDAGYGTTPNSTSAIVTETLKNPNVLAALDNALERRGISVDAAIAPIGRALRDEDINIQLKASDRALKLLGIGQESTNNYIQVVNSFDGKN